MRYISLFAGIGGFDLALNRLGHECVYANDFDKYCKITYDKNFTNQNTRDIIERQAKRQGSRHIGNKLNAVGGSKIRKGTWDRGLGSSQDSHPELDTTPLEHVDSRTIPDHDLLVGGFPCQAFSIAGKRQGFNETRGTLFFEIARILRDKRPRHFILENVKGLLSHDSGKTFQTILKVLSELGYEYQWQVLNSKNFGVPQNRERVFIVGHLRGEPRPQVFPIGEADRATNERFEQKDTKSEVAQTIRQRYGNGTGSHIMQLNQPKHSNDRVYGDDGISPTLNTMGGGRRQPKVMRQPLKFLDRNQKNIEGDYSFRVDGANTGGVRQDMKIRRLTPLECERLQGFPDNWTAGVSDTQRYKQLGNAVTVNVVYEVAKRL